MSRGFDLNHARRVLDRINDRSRSPSEMADVIDNAVDLMERRGRITSVGVSPKGYCPAGALMQVLGMDAKDWGLSCNLPERLAIEDNLPDYVIEERRSLWAFNDWSTDEQVVFDLMRTTAKQLRIMEEQCQIAKTA